MALTLLWYHVPDAMSSSDSAFSQRPSFVIPIKIISYFSGLIARIIVCTDTQETSCSEEQPPNITATHDLLILFPPKIISLNGIIQPAPNAPNSNIQSDIAKYFSFYQSDRFYFTQIQNRIQVVSIQKRNSCGLSCKKCCSHLQNQKRAYIIVVAVRHRLTAF